MTKQGRGQEKEREDGCEKKSHWLVWSIIYLTEFQPTPTPSNPQHNPERPNPTKEPDPHHHNGQRGVQRGEGVIYEKTKNVDAVRRLLGQSSVTATSAYLGVSDNSALELARSINV